MAEQFLTSLDQIRLLRKALGNPATGDVPDTSLAQYLWLAECDLAGMYEFEELRDHEDITTVAGTIDYELEADVLKFLYPADNMTANHPVKMKSAYWDRKVGALMTGSGNVLFFFENGRGANDRKQVRFRPTPAGIETIRVPFIKVPTMPDHEEATISDLPSSHSLQTVSRATEIGLELTGERAEAERQQKLSGKTAFAAESSVAPAGFYRRELVSFRERMNKRRR